MRIERIEIFVTDLTTRLKALETLTLLKEVVQ